MVIMQINGCTQLSATAQSMLLCLMVLLLHAHALLLARVSVQLGTQHDIECISLRDIDRVSVHACPWPRTHGVITWRYHMALSHGVIVALACNSTWVGLAVL